MTSRILNRFKIKTVTYHYGPYKLSCDIHPRKMIKMVEGVCHGDHIIIYDK